MAFVLISSDKHNDPPLKDHYIKVLSKGMTDWQNMPLIYLIKIQIDKQQNFVSYTINWTSLS